MGTFASEACSNGHHWKGTPGDVGLNCCAIFLLGESLVPEPEDQMEEAEHGAEGSKAVTVWGDTACHCRLDRHQGPRGGHRGC